MTNGRGKAGRARALPRRDPSRPTRRSHEHHPNLVGGARHRAQRTHGRPTPQGANICPRPVAPSANRPLREGADPPDGAPTLPRSRRPRWDDQRRANADVGPRIAEAPRILPHPAIGRLFLLGRAHGLAGHRMNRRRPEALCVRLERHSGTERRRHHPPRAAKDDGCCHVTLRTAFPGSSA